jgi:hypothetical protein
MSHALDIWLRLHIDEGDTRPGETPRDVAERLLREIMTVEDKVLEMRISGWMWTARAIAEGS